MLHSSNLSTHVECENQSEIRKGAQISPDSCGSWQSKGCCFILMATWEKHGETNLAGVYHTHNRNKNERCVYSPGSCRYWLCHLFCSSLHISTFWWVFSDPIQWWQVNIVDTPGHADFGAEVERILNMVSSREIHFVVWDVWDVWMLFPTCWKKHPLIVWKHPVSREHDMSKWLKIRPDSSDVYGLISIATC